LPPENRKNRNFRILEIALSQRSVDPEMFCRRERSRMGKNHTPPGHASPLADKQKPRLFCEQAGRMGSPMVPGD